MLQFPGVGETGKGEAVDFFGRGVCWTTAARFLTACLSSGFLGWVLVSVFGGGSMRLHSYYRYLALLRRRNGWSVHFGHCACVWD